MATNVIAFQVGLQQNNNAFSKVYQRYFFRPWYPKTLNLEPTEKVPFFEPGLHILTL
jgi:hypothetical protein